MSDRQEREDREAWMRENPVAAMREVIREELDRKPSGWQAAAEACVAYFRAWNSSSADRFRLFDEAERLVRELDSEDAKRG